MRGLFITLAAVPVILMDGDGPAGGTGGDNDDLGRTGRALTGATRGGPGDPGAHGENIGVGPGFGRGGLDTGAPAGGAGETEGGSGQPGGGGSNRLTPRSEGGQQRSEPVQARPQEEDIRRAVIVLGIPGSLAARANTLFAPLRELS